MLERGTARLRSRCLTVVYDLLDALVRALHDAPHVLGGRIDIDVMGTTRSRQLGAAPATRWARFEMGTAGALYFLLALKRRSGFPMRRARTSGDRALAYRFVWLLGEARGLSGGLNERRYRRIARAVPEGGPLHQNCGYTEPGESLDRPAWLLPEDDAYRYSIQLVRRLVRDVEVEGKVALEVGSGRGGVSAALRRYCGAREVTGLELDPIQAAIAQRTWSSLDGLRFVAGDAQAMPFGDDLFDLVLSLDSHHDYPKKLSFMREAFRVLAPGGRLVLSDHFATSLSSIHLPLYRDALGDVGFVDIEADDLPATSIAQAMKRAEKKLAATLRQTMSTYELVAYKVVLWALLRDYDAGRLVLRSWTARKPTIG